MKSHIDGLEINSFSTLKLKTEFATTYSYVHQAMVRILLADKTDQH